MENQKILLAYWGVRGRAQAIRYLLEYLGLPYEEKRYQLAKYTEWFEDDKWKLNHSFPNLPYVKDGDRVVTETEAIFKYLITKAGKKELFGKTAEDEIDICSTRWALHDMIYFTGELAYKKDFEEQKDTVLQKNIAPKLKMLSTFLGEKEFLHGYFTYADFLAFEIFEILMLMKPELFKDYKNLTDYWTRIENMDFMKNYRASDRFIRRPFYGPAVWNPVD